MQDWSSKFVEKLKQGVNGKLLLLIEYGNASAESDLDLLAVYDEASYRPEMLIGGIDLLALSLEDANIRLALLDPVATEPVLKGKVVYGEISLFEQLVKTLSATTFDAAAQHYLFRKSLEAYFNALAVLETASKFPESHNRIFWSNFSFAVTYWAFAKEYGSNWKKPLRLEEVLSNTEQRIQEFWNTCEEKKKEQDNPLKDKLEFVSAWEQFTLHL